MGRDSLYNAYFLLYFLISIIFTIELLLIPALNWFIGTSDHTQSFLLTPTILLDRLRYLNQSPLFHRQLQSQHRESDNSPTFKLKSTFQRVFQITASWTNNGVFFAHQTTVSIVLRSARTTRDWYSLGGALRNPTSLRIIRAEFFAARIPSVFSSLAPPRARSRPSAFSLLERVNSQVITKVNLW